MPEVQTYKNWKAVTEADFVSLFIKTWFAYISTLRSMFPEAYNRRGDKKYLDEYKKFYKTTGYKKLIVDENIMASIEKISQEGRNVIVKQYPEYYLWDFYNINEEFEYTYKQLSPDKTEGLIVGLKMHRNRGTKWSFIVTGFVKLFGIYYGEHYDENINFKKLIDSSLELKKLFDIISIFNLSNNFEFTVECNLENLTKEKLMLFKQKKVNRLSIGVQTFNKDISKFLNRKISNIEMIKKAQELGFDNINIDLKKQEEKNDNKEKNNDDIIEEIDNEKELNEKEEVNVKTEKVDEYVTYHIHIVKDNETLEMILKKYNVSLDIIKEYNEITDIKVGDKIIVPEYVDE